MLVKFGKKEVSARQFLAEAKFYESYSRFDQDKNRYETWEESVDRVMDMHRTKYSHLVGNPQFDGYLSDITQSYKDKKLLGAQRALQFGGEQLLKHEMKLYNCFSEDTRFITNEGVKSFEDFDDGDQVIVSTHTGNWKTATVKSYGEQKLNSIVFSKGGAKKVIQATANHRWILHDGSETTQLTIGDRLFKEPETFSQFDWETADPLQQLYWCYGYVYGDGTVNGNYSMVRLCKRDRDLENRFVSMGFKTSSSASLEGDVMVYTGSYQKTLPNLERDDPELIGSFVAGYLNADGIRNYNKHGKQYQGIQATGEESIDFIRRAFPIAGVHIISETELTGRETNYGIRPYTVRFTTCDSSGSKYNAGWKVESIEKSKSGTVWCLEVEDDHSFILEGGIVTGNCVSGYADRAKFFNEFFYILLCGCGYGYSVQKHHVAKLPEIQARTRHVRTHVISDDIEGWADAAAVLMSSFFVGGGAFPQYEGKCVYFDPTQIRKKGSLISGGFLAPGPEPLIAALHKIEAILNDLISQGIRKLRPIDVYDIACHLADAVISGGVRRAATICLFSPDDQDMLMAKTGNWGKENPQRARSNNSMVILRGSLTFDEFLRIMEPIKQYGEPGFVFVDDLEICFNPCVEIGMYPQIDGISGQQGCNLTEGNASVVHTAQDFYDICRVSAILGTIQAGYTNFKYVGEETKRIFEREALIGVSFTGWMSNPKVFLDPEVLRHGARIVKETNAEVAKLLGINPAARTTCVKPSGNASTLLAAPPATDGEHAKRWLRVTQMNKTSPIAQTMIKECPYMVEECVNTPNGRDYSIFWPIYAYKGSILKKDNSGIQFLENVKTIQENWVNEGTNIDLCVNKSVRHNVSNTVWVADGNWDEVARYVFDNQNVFTGISFLGPYGDKDYNQAPYTEVLTADEIVKKYGDASMFASGLIVDSVKGFDNLWDACYVAINNGVPAGEMKDNQQEWIRRFNKFAEQFFDGDLKMTEYCLKDVSLLHKWNKIQKTIKYVDFNESFKEEILVDIDSTGAMACSPVLGCEL